MSRVQSIFPLLTSCIIRVILNFGYSNIIPQILPANISEYPRWLLHRSLSNIFTCNIQILSVIIYFSPCARATDLKAFLLNVIYAKMGTIHICNIICYTYGQANSVLLLTMLMLSITIFFTPCVSFTTKKKRKVFNKSVDYLNTNPNICRNEVRFNFFILRNDSNERGATIESISVGCY